MSLHALTVSLFCLSGSLVHAGSAQSTNVEGVLARARLVGPPEQPQLVVPMDVPDWARNLGVTGRERVYKGMCGPDGAVITPEQLYQAAREDLARGDQTPDGRSVAIVGESPQFRIVYSSSNGNAVAFLPAMIEAAEYIDRELDNRVTIQIDFDAHSIPGSTIGQAATDRYRIPWSIYVEGLKAEFIREDDEISFDLPTSSINVLFDGNSSSATPVTSIVLTEPQLRAIFGENAVPQGDATTITFDSDASNNWELNACDNGVSSGDLSLVDVAVHELTHSLGFVSEIDDGGDNANNRISGVDVCRFRWGTGITAPLPGVWGGLPVSIAQFTNFPRLGEDFVGDRHMYVNLPDGHETRLESGDNYQPSHLVYVSNFDDKLGIMDPVLSRGESRCPSFWTGADRMVIDDIGWRPTRQNRLDDCNNNLIQDGLEIDTGFTADVDGDYIPDVCELWRSSSTPPSPAFAGVTVTMYDGTGVTSLNGFDPYATPILRRELATDTEFGSSVPGRVVLGVTGMIHVPSRDEYSFRVGHPGAMNLTVRGNMLVNETSGRSLSWSNASSPLAPQGFTQLEAGWHPITLYAIVTSTSDVVSIYRESRGLGGWQAVGSDELRTEPFPDCDGDRRDDDYEYPGGVDEAVYLGVAGTTANPIDLNTCGSDFDTEIGLWNAAGTLIASDDDGCSVRQSRIVQTLPAGRYYCSVSGYNTFFSNGFGYDFSSTTCTAEGNYSYAIGGLDTSGSLASGHIRFYAFDVVQGPCSDADLVQPFGQLDFFDVSTFLTLFSNHDSRADLAAPAGQWDFFDVSAYLAAFSAGCP